MTTSLLTTMDVSVAELHDELGSIRLCEPRAVEAMQKSLERHGQLSPLQVFPSGGVLQVWDGLKRLGGARRLGWKQLRVQRHELSTVEAKVRMAEVNANRGLSELEEGWLVRSLVRDDGLTLGIIGQKLGRHKSWVCRRQMLVESLELKLQGWVRVGLLGARAAVALAPLPRGNQGTAAELVMHRGLTVRQTELLVAQLLSCAEAAEREALLHRWQHEPVKPADCGSRSRPRKARSEADWMSADIGTVHRSAARLEARLMAKALCACPTAARQIMTQSLQSLVPVLHSLVRIIQQTTAVEAEEESVQ